MFNGNIAIYIKGYNQEKNKYILPFMLMLMFFEAFVVLLNILSSILLTNKSNCNSALSVGLSLISNQ